MKTFKIGLLAIAMLWGSIASWGYTFEVDGIYYNVNAGAEPTVSVTSGDAAYQGHVSIPESVTYEGITYTVTKIGDNAFSYDDITSVDLPSTLVNIGKNAFASTKITSIIFPEKLNYIGASAFDNCEQLKEVFLLGDEYPALYNYCFERNYFSRKFYVKDKDKCSKTSRWYWYEDAIVQYVTFDNSNEFTYTGQVPEVNYTNNLTFYELNMQTENMQKNAGTHTVNFRARYSNGLEVDIPYTYTIDQAPLAVEIHEAEKIYGDPNPSLTYTLSGFVNNEDESVFRKPLQLSVYCFRGSDVGEYPINLNTEDYAENYKVYLLKFRK